MKKNIKIVWDFDEKEYVVFVEGMTGIEGRGSSEKEAIGNFQINLDKRLCE